MKLREARNGAGLGLRETAKMLGISGAQLTELETSETKPSPALGEKIKLLFPSWNDQ